MRFNPYHFITGKRHHLRINVVLTPLRLSIIIAISAICISCASKEPSANAVLEKSIAYHDPDNQWAGFSGALQVVMETPNRTPRVSDITSDLPNRFFRVVSQRDSIQIDYTVENDSCQVRFNGTSEFTAEAAETYQLNCDRALMYRNYYTYLYGLPMKLRDPGTLLSESVESKTFKGKPYLVLQARYEQEVGSDV